MAHHSHVIREWDDSPTPWVGIVLRHNDDDTCEVAWPTDEGSFIVVRQHVDELTTTDR